MQRLLRSGMLAIADHVRPLDDLEINDLFALSFAGDHRLPGLVPQRDHDRYQAVQDGVTMRDLARDLEHPLRRVETTALVESEDIAPALKRLHQSMTAR